MDVAVHLVAGERTQLVVDEDALPELPEFLEGELLLQLRLAHHYDLQKFLLVRLQIGEQPHLLEHLEGKVLRLVDDEHNFAALGDAVEQHLVHLGDEVVLAAREIMLAEFGEDGLEHLRLGDAGVENERGVVVLGVEFVQELATERGLAAAHLADKHDEALFLAHAILQVLQGLLMGGAQVEKLRVGSDMKRHLRKAVVALIHCAKVFGAQRKKHAKTA